MDWGIGEHPWGPETDHHRLRGPTATVDIFCRNAVSLTIGLAWTLQGCGRTVGAMVCLQLGHRLNEPTKTIRNPQIHRFLPRFSMFLGFGWGRTHFFFSLSVDRGQSAGGMPNNKSSLYRLPPTYSRDKMV